MSFVSGFLQLAWCFHGSSIIACISTSLLFTALSGFGILLLYVLDISKVLTPCKYIAAPGKFKSRASLEFAVFKRPYLKSMGLQRVRQDLATKQQQWYLWRTRWPSRERIHLQCSRQEMQVQSLGQEDPLEDLGNPLQYPCLENPMDRGARRASPWGHKESDTTG